MITVNGEHMTSFRIAFQTEEDAKENERSRSVTAFLKHISDIRWCSTVVAVVAQTSQLLSASYFKEKLIKLF